MLNLFHACFTSSITLCDTREDIREPKEGTNLIYRDELNKKILRLKKVKKVNFLADREEDTKNLEKRSCLYDSSGTVEEKGVIRVKVKMTKQEAARLLSKCKDGRVLEFKDVAHELVQIPINRVSVVPFVDGLKTIPEEI